MAIQKEIWKDYIVENLFQDNPHLNLAVVADDMVDGKTVHIPNAGSVASVSRNRSSFPASASQRTDNDASYDIDEFSMDPVYVQNAEETEASYDKMASLLVDVMQTLRDQVGNWAFYNWRATSGDYITRTTGASVTAHCASATGTRKKLLAADLATAARILDVAKAPGADRYCAIDPYMYEQLLQDLRFGEFRDSVKEADLARGIIGNLFGFQILKRHTVLRYTNAGTPVPVAPDTSGATTHNGSALCWQRTMVERALGDILVFESLGDPLYYGDIVSGLVRAGGRKRRYDGVGVVAIVQAAV